MLINDIFRVILIPSIFSSGNNTNIPHSSSVEFDDDNWTDFSKIFNATSTKPVEVEDPLLASVNEDIRQLHLEYPDDYFDHLEDKSDEVRDLIRRRQQGLLTPPPPMLSSSPNPTEFPILIPTIETIDVTTTTKKSSVIGNAVTGIKNEAGSFIGKIVTPISVSHQS